MNEIKTGGKKRDNETLKRGTTKCQATTIAHPSTLSPTKSSILSLSHGQFMHTFTTDYIPISWQKLLTRGFKVIKILIWFRISHRVGVCIVLCTFVWVCFHVAHQFIETKLKQRNKKPLRSRCESRETNTSNRVLLTKKKFAWKIFMRCIILMVHWFVPTHLFNILCFTVIRSTKPHYMHIYFSLRW